MTSSPKPDHHVSCNTSVNYNYSLIVPFPLTQSDCLGVAKLHSTPHQVTKSGKDKPTIACEPASSWPALWLLKLQKVALDTSPATIAKALTLLKPSLIANFGIEGTVVVTWSGLLTQSGYYRYHACEDEYTLGLYLSRAESRLSGIGV